jgi:hypothetical protein
MIGKLRDDLVGGGEERRGNSATSFCGGLEVDGHFEFYRLLDGEIISGFRRVQYFGRAGAIPESDGSSSKRA